MPGVAEQEAPAVAERGDETRCARKYEIQLKSESPTSVPTRVLSSAASSAADGGPSRESCLVAIDEDEEPSFGKRREQHEAARPDGDARAPRRAREGELDVRDDKAPAVGYPVKMLLHGMAGRVVAAACADQVAGPDDLLAPAFVEGHRDAVVIGLDRRCLDAELDLKALPGQMVAQRLLRNPLGLAALEIVFAPQTCEFCEPNARLSGPRSSISLMCTLSCRNGLITPALSRISSVAG